jgi:hypothetical protein
MSANSSALFNLLFALFGALILLVPAVFFILTQQNTLKAIRPENRLLYPGLVWLQLIPFFNLYWLFHVVVRISKSAVKENLAFRDDSILGIGFQAPEQYGKYPTMAMGICYSVLWAIYFLLFFTSVPRDSALVYGIIPLCMTVCWITYWVQLAQLKRRIRSVA